MMLLVFFISILCLVYWALKKDESPFKLPINKEVEDALSKTELEIENLQFSSIFEPVKYNEDWFIRHIPPMSITERQIQSLLSMNHSKVHMA
jgi:hypothetical protein